MNKRSKMGIGQTGREERERDLKVTTSIEMSRMHENGSQAGTR